MSSSENESSELSDNEEMEQQDDEKIEQDSGTNTESEDNTEKTEIRTELKDMPFEDLLKLKNEIGTKDYNEAIFGKTGNAKKSQHVFNKKSEKSSDDDDEPVEISSKKRVPLLGMGKKIKEKPKFRDPRFDSRSGYFNGRKFREQYSFVNDIRQDEISELKQKLNATQDPEERKMLKFLIQRNENKNREYKKQVDIDEKRKSEKDGIKKDLLEGKKPYYVKKSTKKAEELVEKFEKLKESGKLPKHIDKRRKKTKAKDRKKLDFTT